MLYKFRLKQAQPNNEYAKDVNIKTDYSNDHLGTKKVADVMYGCLVRNSATEGQQRVHFLS